VKTLVAKLEVVGVRPDGERLGLRAEIGRPRAGHAVWLACALVLKLLGNLKAEGWRLENDDGSEFPLEAYRSGLGPAPH